jgi:hypothetical protein
MDSEGFRNKEKGVRNLFWPLLGEKGVRNLFWPLLDHRRFGFTVFPYLLALRG